MRQRYKRFSPDGGKLDCLWEEYSISWAKAAGMPATAAWPENAVGCPAWSFATEVLGVTPTKPGFAEFTIRPRLGDLEWAEGVVPSPKGDIPVRVERKGRQVETGCDRPRRDVRHGHLAG